MFTMHWINAMIDREFRIYETIYLLVQMTNFASAGVCWLGSDVRTGSCREAFSLNMTREECCNISHNPSISWTPEDDISRSRLFLINFLRGEEVRCQRCHNSCDTVQCPDGRVCRMKQGLPECLCKPHCETRLKQLGPFCGTDGRKYKNYCSLLRQNCLYHQQVEISYFGKCRKSCRRVKCVYGNHCLQDQNGIPHCVSCHDKCPHTIPDNSSNYICGSDGRTYKNDCDLKAAICQKGQSIKIAYRGPCLEHHACTNINCPSHKKCLLDVRTGTPTCTDCTKICLSTFYIPVCGTDGQTYSSYCQMQKTSCNRGLAVRARRAGACKGPPNSVNYRRNHLRKIHRRKKNRHRKAKLDGENNDTEDRNLYSHGRKFRNGNPKYLILNNKQLRAKITARNHRQRHKHKRGRRRKKERKSLTI